MIDKIQNLIGQGFSDTNILKILGPKAIPLIKKFRKQLDDFEKSYLISEGLA